MLSELLDLCDISVTTWCFIYHILHNKHILTEIGGLISFKHDQVATRSHFMLIITNEITHILCSCIYVPYNCFDDLIVIEGSLLHVYVHVGYDCFHNFLNIFHVICNLLRCVISLFIHYI